MNLGNDAQAMLRVGAAQQAVLEHARKTPGLLYTTSQDEGCRSTLSLIMCSHVFEAHQTMCVAVACRSHVISKRSHVI